MGDFKRSPSKVWWASESVEWREVSASPRSQDSGFSDTETSPTFGNNKTTIQTISKYIFKEAPDKSENLSANYQEKSTPDKSIKSQLGMPSPKVSRNLFSVKDASTHRYSGAEDSEIKSSDVASKTLPAKRNRKECLNRSAPAVLSQFLDEEEISFNGNHSLSSDCESELECLFNGPLDSPKHTSTPKASTKMRYARVKLPLNLYFKCHQERLTHNTFEALKNDAVHRWMCEMQHNYEQECMTTLQSKSIAGELNQKVAKMASYTTNNIRSILTHAECIENEYKNLSDEKKHIGPLAQSLAGNILDFFKTYSREVPAQSTKQYDNIRKAKPEEVLNLVGEFFNSWQAAFQEALRAEVRKLVEKLENPCSELDLRATVTGLTSLCLRNEPLIDVCVKNSAVPILLILCEKCEGSSMRGLLFRALATMCNTAQAVRQFEKFSGIHVIAETLAEDAARPEPERSEAVALLAQVTAPWIEDNHAIGGLEECSRKLIKALTRFLSTTKCCQNLLLCGAALANLSTMDGRCIKHMLRSSTAQLLLEAVSRRGPCVSVYLLEQAATVIANMTAVESGRKQLTKLRTVEALLCFLKAGGAGEEAEKRLQQKAIIALSRLCSERAAAAQVVESGGVQKLVKLCREKNERFGSDAVLVATLATLRKIADACGKDVISSEDAQELVEPKLLDSFLAYSTQSESYV